MTEAARNSELPFMHSVEQIASEYIQAHLQTEFFLEEDISSENILSHLMRINSELEDALKEFQNTSGEARKFLVKMSGRLFRSQLDLPDEQARILSPWINIQHAALMIITNHPLLSDWPEKDKRYLLDIIIERKILDYSEREYSILREYYPEEGTRLYSGLFEKENNFSLLSATVRQSKKPKLQLL